MDAPKKSWRIRFSLKSLLVVFTAVAVLAWFYWTGRFLWQEAKLEHSVKQLKCGQTFEDAITVCGQNHVALLSAARGPQGELYGWIRFQWPNATYLLVAGLNPSADGTLDSCEITSIRLYRLPPAPHDYMPQTDRGRRQAAFDLSRNGKSKDEVRKYAYWTDFLAVLVGESPDTLGFQDELIYSDPPAQTPSK
ncbi:hypothetical protein [Lacipirellula parvula]|nr:hypothetical protein [Lacipirellula parvula]